MSRIGKMPVEIPDGVEVTIEDHTIKVKGPKGELTRKIHEAIEVKVEDGQIVVTRPSDEKLHKSLHGLTRTLIANMVEGVTKGYERTLEIRGVGYRASKQGNKLVLNVGYSHPVEVEAPAGIEFEVPSPRRSSCGASTRNWWAKWRPTCGRCASPNLISARGSCTWVSGSSARRARPARCRSKG